jgi:uncharacterized SAM-binding protein YcdF (DUF218 family)
MNILIILLGCHIGYILDDRIHAALSFSQSIQNYSITNIDWFLSGGIKDIDKNTRSEADKMREKIVELNENKYYNYGNNNDFNYILDSLSTNTAENFIMANQFINNISYSYDTIYVVTSDFHNERAKRFADFIIPNNEFNWILSSFEEISSRHWERIHLKNVENDIENAMNKFKYFS